MQTRRGIITGLISLVAAPAIIRVNHLMPISVVPEFVTVSYNWKRFELDGFIYSHRDLLVNELRKNNAFLDNMLKV